MRLTILPILALAFSGTSAIAADSSIHSMVVGDKTLELVDTRQLTFRADGNMAWAAVSPDGRYVAYGELAGSMLKVHIASSKGGSVRSLDLRVETSETRPDFSEEWLEFGCGAWSPDSRSLVVTGRYTAPDSPDTKDALIHPVNIRAFIIQADGKLAASYDLQRKASEYSVIPRCATFSPDSRQLALLLRGFDPQGRESANRLQIVDVSSGRGKALYSTSDKHEIKILSWTKDGSALLCDDNGSLMKISLESGHTEKLYDCGSENQADRSYSPDGKYAFCRPSGMENASGITVRNVETGKDMQVAKSGEAEFERWFPNGDLLLYVIRQTIRDDSGKRTRDLRTIWLASVTGHGDHSMCVALDADSNSATFSSDYRRMAYILNGRVHLAELEWRAPTPGEKLAAGLKLTEEEEKTILLQNGKQIGLVLICYCVDWDGAFPASDSYEEDLKEYIRGGNLFARPGTDTNVFKYLGGDLNDSTIEDSATTLVGELDAGYSWKVIIYADGHVKVVQK